jgi:hypothetical protein
MYRQIPRGLCEHADRSAIRPEILCFHHASWWSHMVLIHWVYILWVARVSGQKLLFLMMLEITLSQKKKNKQLLSKSFYDQGRKLAGFEPPGSGTWMFPRSEIEARDWGVGEDRMLVQMIEVGQGGTSGEQDHATSRLCLALLFDVVFLNIIASFLHSGH